MLLLSRWILPLLFVAFLLARPHVSSGNPFETYGYGSRAISLGGAYSAVADDFAATFYNPAGLPQIGDVDLGVGLTFFNTDFHSIRNVVVGETPGGEPIVGDVDTDMGDNGGFLAGVAVGLMDDIAVGIGLFVPSTDYLARLQTQNQREPNFIWYEKRSKRFSILASVGFRVYRGLHLGAGIDVLFGPKGTINLRLPAGGEGTADLALTFRPRIAPYAGLLYKMENGMRFALVYKDKKNQGEVDLTLDARVESDQLAIPLAGKLESMIFYSPHQVVFGWAWKPGERINLSLDLAWLQWSQFEDATLGVDFRVGPNGSLVPFQRVLDPGLQDTLLPRAGIEYIAKRWSLFPLSDRAELALRGGYYFVKSPVEEQTGVTNFLDSDSHVFSAGLGLAFRSLFGSTRALKLDVHFQFHQLMDREHRKAEDRADLDGDGIRETVVIGYPGYVTGGNVLAGGFTLGMSF